MAMITLSSKQVAELKTFCKTHSKDKFFLAKDQGAYVGAAGQDEIGQMENCIFYFKGCDPLKDDDWYENAHDKFGGDDFGEFLPATWLDLPQGTTKMRIATSTRSIKVSYL